MALTPEVHFRSIAKDFLQISTLLKDEWKLEQQNGSIYLRKQQVMKVKRPDIQTDGKTELANDMELAEEVGAEDLGEADPACLESCKTAEDDVLKFDYHILYSESYGVPVLYFNVYRQDGSLISLDGVWNLVPPVYQERLKEERWTFITQQELPGELAKCCRTCGAPYPTTGVWLRKQLSVICLADADFWKYWVQSQSQSHTEYHRRTFASQKLQLGFLREAYRSWPVLNRAEYPKQQQQVVEQSQSQISFIIKPHKWFTSKTLLF